MKKNNKYSSEPPEVPGEHLLTQYEQLTNEEKEKTIMNPGHVDEGKWKKAKEASMKEYGEYRWPAIMFIYEQMGGKT